MTTFTIHTLAHASLIVADVTASLKFYCDILGFVQQQDRPDLGYPGAWLKIGAQQIHLLQLPNPDPVSGRPEHGGRDRHLAFYVTGIETLNEKLAQAGIPFTRSKSGRAAIFFRDPDGNALEIIEP